MRDGSWDHHDIARAVAKDSVGDMNVAAPGVFGLGFHGYPPVPPTSAYTSSLTPSLVFAYWMRGSMAALILHPGLSRLEGRSPGRTAESRWCSVMAIQSKPKALPTFVHDFGYK